MVSRPFTGKDKYWLDGEQWGIEEKHGLVVKEYEDKRLLKVVRDLSMAPEVTTEAVVEERPSQPPAPQAVSREAREAVVTSGEVMSPGSDELREEKLDALKKWKEAGLITDEDYEKEKAQILQQVQPL